MTIQEVNMLAHLEGMTYGKYVQKMGQKLNRASDEYILQPGEIRCKCCNRAFMPRTKNMKYCKPECRTAKRKFDDATKRREAERSKRFEIAPREFARAGAEQNA